MKKFTKNIKLRWKDLKAVIKINKMRTAACFLPADWSVRTSLILKKRLLRCKACRCRYRSTGLLKEFQLDTKYFACSVTMLEPNDAVQIAKHVHSRHQTGSVQWCYS